MSDRVRTMWMALIALALVGGVLGVQLASGGGDFEPLRTADPCAERAVRSQADGIDGLTERLVLLGIDGAACRLNMSREALTLELAKGGTPTAAETDALREGLRDGVDRMAEDGSLPRVSELVDEALDNAELNGFLEAAIRALPDSVIDAALKTDDVLLRTIDDLDLRALLENLEDTDDLNRQLETAVTEAVEEALTDRLGELL